MAQTKKLRAPVIGDVARLAGVSVPTVSRVLTGASFVSPEKRERVLDAVAKLRYSPNAAARSLPSGRSKTIAVLSHNPSFYGYAQTLRGVEAAARAAGYVVLILTVDAPSGPLPEATLKLLGAHRVAGIVTINLGETLIDIARGLPTTPAVAALGTPQARYPHALLDEQSGAVELTDHLLDLGHATVHHVRFPSGGHLEPARSVGWRDALLRRGIVPTDPIEVSHDPRSAIPVGTALASRPEVTAVFCANDETAMGIIRGLVDAGKRVPEDVSVVGFDDHPHAELYSPPLTTVGQDFPGVGQRAVELLLAERSPGNSATVSTAPTQLRIRKSSAPPPGT